MKNRLRNINLPAEIWDKYTVSLGTVSAEDFQARVKEFIDGREYVLECCCGKGEFVSEEAKKHPDKRFIAVDYSYPVLQRAAKRSAAEELDNVLYIFNAIEDIFESLGRFKGFERIYINFSDPWPKKRHWKRRVVQKETLMKITELMDDKTLLYVVTDHDGYKDWIYDIFRSMDDIFQPVNTDWYVNTMEEFNDSDYMKKGKIKGHDINFFVAEKLI